MRLDSAPISIEHFKRTDLRSRRTPQHDMESSTSVPKTKMASPSTPQHPAAPVSNHSNILETFKTPENAMKTQLSPVQCPPHDSTSVEGVLQSTIVNKNAAVLPSMPQNDKKSPTFLPDISKDYNISPTVVKKSALLDRNALEMPSVTANNLEISSLTSKGLKMASSNETEARLSPKSDLNTASDSKNAMGVVLTCHDRLETALTPTNIIEYKSMGNIDSKNVDGLSKQVSETPKSNMTSTASLPQNGRSKPTMSADQNNTEFIATAGQLELSLTLNCEQNVITDIKNKLDAASLGPEETKNEESATNFLSSVDQNGSEGFVKETIAKPDRLDLPLNNSDAFSLRAKTERVKSSSKSPSVEKISKTPTRNTGASLSVSQNRVKSSDSTPKRVSESPTKPKIITKSPSRDKMDKKAFRYSIGALPGPGAPLIKMADEASLPKCAMALPSKPKPITKSPSKDKMPLRSTSDMSSMPQYKMATASSMAKAVSKCSSIEKSPAKNATELSVTPQNKKEDSASSPKTNMATSTKPRTVPRTPSVDKMDVITSKNAAELSVTPQNKMADACLVPQPTSTSPTKPQTSSKFLERTPSRKTLRKELSCPSEPSPASASDRRASLRPPWRGGAWTPSRSQTSPSLAQSGFIRRSESSMSVNAGLRSRAGLIRPATSLPHIPKSSSSSRPCLLVALRPTNLQQEKDRFFESGFKYEPQFEYEEAELSAVLEKYRVGSDLFLQQAVGIMECVLRKYGSYEIFEEATGGAILPKSQVWAAVRKYLQKEGCVGEVVVRLSDELLSQAVMVIENCRPTLTINLAGARQHWLEGMLRHEIGTHYLRGVNNNLQPWSSSDQRKALGLRGANPTEEGLASLHSVLLRKQPFLWRAALLYYTVHHASHMSFTQLFHHIQRFVSSPEVRWEYCLRAKRGQTDTSKPGCFSKDQVYLDGILRILRHRRNIDFQLLTALGKVSFEDVERLRSLAVLSRTRIPHFMTDPDKYLSHLDHIVSVNELSDEELERLLP
ncbi:mucin-2-like [Boleophthalmus pectinirostris]|uniref:mucin-2-like n=1 Tax=Boleophthalmus pectinirostris TaxID=150288 RepID=UPI00242A33C2|nr:mucin-2-like [Boleophthalmus pectinirostris]